MSLQDRLDDIAEQISYLDDAIDALCHVPGTEEIMRELHDMMYSLRVARDIIGEMLDKQALDDEKELEREYWRSR